MLPFPHPRPRSAVTLEANSAVGRVQAVSVMNRSVQNCNALRERSARAHRIEPCHVAIRELEVENPCIRLDAIGVA